MTVTITKPTIGQGPGWGVLNNAALDALATEINTFETTVAAGYDTFLVPTAVKTGAYTAVAGDFVPVDTTSGAITITLPTAPADKTRVAVKLVTQVSTNAVTVLAGGSDLFNKTGGPASVTLTLLRQGGIYQYKASNAVWYVLAGELGVAELDARYNAVYVPFGPQSATAVVTATSGTIATAATVVSRVAPAAAITAVVLASGTFLGQVVTVVNEAAFSITFAASGTSHVADGVSDVIPALTARMFTWDSITSLWYRHA